MNPPAPLHRAAALSLVSAPLLLTVADALQLINHGAIGWTVVMWLAFVLFVPSIFALAHLLRPQIPGMALVAGAITLLGAMAGAAMQALFRALVTLEHVGLDPGVAATVQAALRGNTPLHLTTLVPGALFPLGLLLFSAALVRTRVVPLPASLLLGLGAVLFPVGHAAGVPIALIGGDLVLLLALGWIAYQVATRPELWPGGSSSSVALGEGSGSFEAVNQQPSA